jgi:NAD(P)-dependent dehydrogenase (short-subunit alcohol dehydrogenase family)
MISSVGGKNASPFVGPYNASKFALEGLSESLRRELMLFGIDVIIVAPGSVATPIWDKAEKLDLAQYDNTPYMKPLATVKDFMLGLGRKGFPPEKLGEAVAVALTAARPKTRYQVSPQPMLDFLQVALPKRLVDRVVARQVGLKRQA